MIPSVEFRLDRWGTLWVRAFYNDGDEKGNVSLPVSSWLSRQKNPRP